MVRRTNDRYKSYSQIVYERERTIKVFFWIALISSILSLVSSIRCLVYNSTINDLKKENEAKTAQIETLKEQKDRLESDLRYFIDKEEK